MTHRAGILLLFVVTACAAGAVPKSFGEEGTVSSAASKGVAPPHSRAGRPLLVESANFVLMNVPAELPPEECAQFLEATRLSLYAYWAPKSQATWRPKCVVDFSEDRISGTSDGRELRGTVGASYLAMRRGKVTDRRIQIHDQPRELLMGPVPHELTHVILADRFPNANFPLWADEGMAVLADPCEKQSRHYSDLKEAMADDREFRLVALFRQADYPSDEQLGVFYGQSASLVSFLVSQSSPERFIDFVEDVIARGHEPAIRRHFAFEGVAGLESAWLRSVNSRLLVARRVPLPGSPAERALSRVAAGPSPTTR